MRPPDVTLRDELSGWTVYALMNRGSCSYVGMSARGIRRAFQHARTKAPHTRILIWRCATEFEARELETQAIRELNPRANIIRLAVLPDPEVILEEHRAGTTWADLAQKYSVGLKTILRRVKFAASYHKAAPPVVVTRPSNG